MCSARTSRINFEVKTTNNPAGATVYIVVRSVESSSVYLRGEGGGKRGGGIWFVLVAVVKL